VSLPLILSAIATAVAVGNQLQNFIEKRRAGRTDEHRLDVEGLTTLVRELRAELDRVLKELATERDGRRVDRARISELESTVDTLKRDLRKAHDALDKIAIDREMKG
jgi:cell division FtsZ-interacting protein ZapD